MPQYTAPLCVAGIWRWPMYGQMRRFISGPTISRLTGTPRMTVNDRLRAGSYGPTFRTFRRGRIVFADVEGVEYFHGVPFTDAQLEAAIAGYPERIITIPTETVEAA